MLNPKFSYITTHVGKWDSLRQTVKTASDDNLVNCTMWFQQYAIITKTYFIKLPLGEIWLQHVWLQLTLINWKSITMSFINLSILFQLFSMWTCLHHITSSTSYRLHFRNYSVAFCYRHKLVNMAVWVESN